MKWWTGLLCAGALVGCVGPDPELEEIPFAPASETAAPVPSEFGPFQVGVRTEVWVDETRLNPAEDGPRTLTVEIWYPATAAVKDDPRVTYLLWDELPESQQDRIAPEVLGEMPTEAVRDAAVQPDRGPFPLVVFSHGKGGIRMQSTFHTVLLASHGYVVISADHQGDTVPDILEEGEVVISTTLDSIFDRPLDVSFMIDVMEELEPDHFLYGLADLERIGVVGHSMGALTAFRTAGGDARVDAIVGHTPVGITPVNLGLEVKLEDFEIPTAIQAAGLDETLDPTLHADSLWPYMPNPKEYLMLPTAGHFTYSDLCILDVLALDEALDIDVAKVLDDGCGEENIAPDDAFPLINQFTVGFFNVHLRGSTATYDQMNQRAADDIAPGLANYKYER